MTLEREGREADPATADLAMAPEHLAAELEIHRAVAGRLERKALFTAVAEALRRVSPVSRVILLLPSTDPSSLRVYAAHGREGTSFFEGESIPRATTMPGWVVEHRLPLVASSADEIRERFPVSYAKLLQEGMDSVAVLPLLAAGRCVGALSLMAERAGAWDAVPTGLLTEIAAWVAVAVDSSVTYEEVGSLRDEMKALLDVNRAVARHLRRDELFATLARSLGTVMPADRFGIELRVAGDKLRAHVLSPRAAAAAPAQVEELPAAGTACRWVEENQQWLVSSSRAEIQERFPVTFHVMRRENMESLCAMPLVTGGRCLGVLFFMAAERGAYQERRLELLEQMASTVAVALDNCLAYEEVQSLRDRLAAENVYLQEEIKTQYNFDEIVGESRALRRVLEKIETVAATDSSVLVTGETGTGKELVARALHSLSRRRDRPLIKVDCAALPAGLVESELFGHVRGAFTGASENRVGRFALADGGTIFLDEVGELPPEAQAKLLRVLQEQAFEPVGSSRTTRVDVRVIAATNRDLEAAAREGGFRRDLLYRLNVFPIHVPPLRERKEDIPLLAAFFLSILSKRIGKTLDGFSSGSIERLQAYSWPGNVRELQNVVEHAAIMAKGPILDVGTELIPAGTPAADVASPALGDVERRHILSVLDQTGGVVEGPRGAARVLGLHPNTLRSRLARLGIHPRRHESP
jgi:formate hydrogenlyase transcriptional activator